MYERKYESKVMNKKASKVNIRQNRINGKNNINWE